MNKERMLQLADFIEQLPAHKFDMANWAIDQANTQGIIDCKALNPHQCKTAGCIAGWAIYLFSERKPLVYDRSIGRMPWRSPPNEAQEILGLNDAEVHALFQGHAFERHFDDITPAMAATVMRKMVADEPASIDLDEYNHPGPGPNSEPLKRT